MIKEYQNLIGAFLIALAITVSGSMIVNELEHLKHLYELKYID